MGNKTDLGHLRSVRPDRHVKFSEEHEMSAFFVSAKTGDNIASCFLQIAANLAGVQLQGSDKDASSQVVRADIVNHGATTLQPSVQEPAKKNRCTIQ